MKRKIIVVGGGIAGLQAAIFTTKAKKDTLVIDTGESLVNNTANIQNLIGFDSVSGKELLRSGKEKIEEFGGEITDEKVEKIERNNEEFLVNTEDSTYKAEYVVLASAGVTDYLEDLDIEFEEGVEGPYMMDKHVKTDGTNKAADKLYAAGLINSWEYQTSTCIGDGSKAAVNLLTEINGEPFMDHDT